MPSLFEMCTPICPSGAGLDVGETVLAKIKKGIKEGERQRIRSEFPMVYFTPQSVVLPPETGAGARVTFTDFDLKLLQIQSRVQIACTAAQVPKAVAVVAKEQVKNKMSDSQKKKAEEFKNKGKDKAAMAKDKAASLAKKLPFGIKKKNDEKVDGQAGEKQGDGKEDDPETEDMQEPEKETEKPDPQPEEHEPGRITEQDEETESTIFNVLVVVDVKKSLSLGEDVEVTIRELKMENSLFQKLLNQPSIHAAITNHLSKKISAAANQKMSQKLKEKGLK